MRQCLTAVVLWMSAAGLAQSADLPVELDARGGSFAAMTVSNLDASAAWYARVLGMRETFAYAAPNGDVKIKVLAAPGLLLELQQHAQSVARAVPEDKGFLQRGIFKLGFYVADVDRAFRVMTSEGAVGVVKPFTDANAQLRMAVLRDAEGNTLQLLGHLPPPAK